MASGATSTYIATVSVVMPIPDRSEDYVASPHRDPFAVDGGEPAFTFNDETHGESDVSMGWSGFMGHNELQTTVDGVGGVRGLIAGWIDEHQDAALGLFLSDQFAGADQVWTDVLVAPDVGFALGVWFGRVEFGHLCPEGEGVGIMGA